MSTVRWIEVVLAMPVMSAPPVSLSLPPVSTTRFIVTIRSGLVVYETLITVDREVRYFWPGSITVAKLLFFANRYVTLLAYVVWLSQLASLSDKVSYHQVVGPRPRLLIAITSVFVSHPLEVSCRCGFIISTHEPRR